MSWQDTATDLLPYYEYTMGFFSYALNILVIYLAKTQMHKRTAEYRTIILLNCAVDLIFNTFNLLTRTACDIKEGNIFVLSTGPLGDVPQPYAAMITFSWLWALLLTVVTVPIQFLYRYSQICLTTPITTRQYVLIYGGFILALALHCAAGVVVFETDPEVLKGYEHLIRENPIFKDMPVFTLGIKLKGTEDDNIKNPAVVAMSRLG
uniref:G protein-coupled receptor n=1 Tax=Bursaphelenchus xylophilus TaxID=6326 RepID=A0A1I7RWQ2_BURXY